MIKLDRIHRLFSRPLSGRAFTPAPYSLPHVSKRMHLVRRRVCPFSWQAPRSPSGHLAPHEYDADEIEHFDGPDHLRIGEPGKKERVFLEYAKDIAQEIRGERGPTSTWSIISSPKITSAFSNFFTSDSFIIGHFPFRDWQPLHMHVSYFTATGLNTINLHVFRQELIPDQGLYSKYHRARWRNRW